MHAKKVGVVLLWVWVGLVVGCSSNPPEEWAVASSEAPLVEGWQGAGSLPDTRKNHAGLVLQSGKVLVVGGAKGEVSQSSATVYAPGTGSWTGVAALPDARDSHAVALLSTGRVLVVGGQKRGTAGGPLASAAVYDATSTPGTWAPAGMFATGVARHSLTATVLKTGKVLVAGGGNLGGSQSAVDVYDPETGNWSWSPGQNMGTPRRDHTATLLSTGKVLVVGGRWSASLAAAEEYNPQSNTWTKTKGPLETARHSHTATLLPSGNVLVVGGRNNPGGGVTGPVVGTAEEYDLDEGTWSTVPAPSVPGVVLAREQHTATLLATGKVLVAGGLDASGNSLKSAVVYDPETRQWSVAPAMATARHGHVALPLESLGKVLVVAGLSTGNGVTAGVAAAEAYVYDVCEGVVCNSAPSECHEAAGTCSNRVCSYVLKAAGASCDDKNACTGGDTCNSAGVCAGSALSCSTPPGQCYQQAGTCSNGSCDYTYKAAGDECNDNDACTTGDMCNGAGGCGGTEVSCNNPPNDECYEAAGTCSGGDCSYTPKQAGAPCNDGNGGTLNDVCNGAGVCAGVVACTTPDACHDSPGTYINGVCTYPLKEAGTSCGTGQVCTATGACASGCWIAGAYYAAGATNPSGACQVCNPSVSTSSWSFKPATTQCRASGGVCDAAEYCTGTGANCPADSKLPAGTSCNDNNAGTTGDRCDGAGVCTGCGDGVTNGPEACDYGNNTGCPYGQSCLQCNTSCTGFRYIQGDYCGDGAANGPEACDYGNNMGCPYGQSCPQCNTSCTGFYSAPGGYCGDGSANGPEACDYGNNTGCPYGQSCTQCNDSCTGFHSAWGPFCGDGVINGPEACDYGNNSQCNTSCTGTIPPPPSGVCSSSNATESLFIGWYQQYLNRCADEGGLAFWVSEYQSGSTCPFVVDCSSPWGCMPFYRDYSGFNWSYRNDCFRAEFLHGAELSGEYP